ncbi:anti-sigma factor family protein [Actibacterium ureilyticum]|uniref:anti-sigma factor family protein n=1 Tax=Actibacterium ureilyticum TaxID=1590614 RepID=UPI000BAAC2B0|nr:anti-sigma factor [Actibacterium ureilyticum]
MTPDRLTEDELIAYFEDALPPADRARVAARLEHDPEAQAQLADWARQNADIRALYADQADTPVPDRLRAALHRAPPPRRFWPQQVAAMLAVLGVGLAGGWTTHAALQPPPEATRLAQAAISAHDTYVVEVVHPVEVASDQRDHMDTWMSNRMGTQMRPPDLAAAGFTLMGGRILPTAGDRPAGLYMYENADGQRITLYVSHQPSGNSAFQFAGDGTTQSLYWTDDGLGYALVGAMPRDRLKTVAKQAYDQLL